MLSLIKAVGDDTDLDRLFDSLTAADDIIAKVLDISEVARIARMETGLREYITAKWEARAARAVKVAGRMIRSGSGEPKKAEINRINTAIAAVMRPWAKEVSPRVKADLAKMYKLARIAGHKKATGQTKKPLSYDVPKFEDEGQTVKKAKKPSKKKPSKKPAKTTTVEVLPSFDVVDEAAVASLQTHQLYWIGEHYDDHIGATITGKTEETIIAAGRDRVAAGKALEETVTHELAHISIPKGFHGTSREYFAGLAANAATAARAMGQLRSFQMAGIITYTIVNPMDSRTCPVCSHMDGKRFEVPLGLEQMEKEVSSKKPEDIKTIHPWVTEKKLKEISPKAGHAGKGDMDALAAAGLAMPPFHFLCRCAVDMDVEEEPVFEVGDEIEYPSTPDLRTIPAR